jgi:hypothetical protein
VSEVPARYSLFVALGILAVAAGCGSSHPSVSPTGPTSTAGGGGAGQSVHFTGLVGTVTGECPAITLLVGTRTVNAIRTTSFQTACSDVKRGTLLDVQGVEVDTGPVLAEQVSVQSDGPGAVGLLTDVASGGYVLFFRHSERDAGAISTGDLAAVDNRGDCVPGSELTPNGVSDAIALGDRFRRYGIDVEKVYASPTCRTTEMARLAFVDFEVTRALTYAGMWAPGEGDLLAAALRKLLATVPGRGRNIILIAHNDVLRSARVGVDLTLDQAEAAVFRPRGGETFDYLGRIPKAEWLGRR